VGSVPAPLDPPDDEPDDEADASVPLLEPELEFDPLDDPELLELPEELPEVMPPELELAEPPPLDPLPVPPSLPGPAGVPEPPHEARMAAVTMPRNASVVFMLASGARLRGSPALTHVLRCAATIGKVNVPDLSPVG
jgi:hypothetical protein